MRSRAEALITRGRAVSDIRDQAHGIRKLESGPGKEAMRNPAAAVVQETVACEQAAPAPLCGFVPARRSAAVGQVSGDQAGGPLP